MEKKEIILEAAKKLFYQNGYKQTKVEDIAKLAGASKVTVFKYFDKKSKLAHAVVLEAIKKGYSDFGLIVNDNTISFKEKAQRMIEAKYSGANEIHPDFREFMLSDMQANHGDNETLAEYNRGKEKFWHDFFSEGRKSGQLRSEISNKTILMYIDMLMNYVVDRSDSDTETLELIDLFFYGIMKNDWN